MVNRENDLLTVAPVWRKKIVVVIGALGVVLGAFGAHVLNGTLEANGTLDVWKTAVFYHLIHAVVLLVITFSLKEFNKYSWVCFVTGIILFSGSLYLLALYQFSYLLGPVTPFGGALLIGGWISLLRS
tara:strand:- start:180 stop:563 length:384 start_codon:yes stop_codon:yes gene_type:complete